MVAEKMEAQWAGLMPLTHAAFDGQRPGRALSRGAAPRDIAELVRGGSCRADGRVR